MLYRPMASSRHFVRSIFAVLRVGICATRLISRGIQRMGTPAAKSFFRSSFLERSRLVSKTSSSPLVLCGTPKVSVLPPSWKSNCPASKHSDFAHASAGAFGPVFIETQKQVPPAWLQFRATMNAFLRRSGVHGVAELLAREDLVLNRHRVQFAGADAK
jgi:hypothetical protein